LTYADSGTMPMGAFLIARRPSRGGLLDPIVGLMIGIVTGFRGRLEPRPAAYSVPV